MGFLNPGQGYSDAQDQLNKYYNQGQGYLQPYNQHGQDQYNNLNTYINKFMDPAKLQSDWSNSYKESDFAKNQAAMSQEQGVDAASALGLNGSNSALNAIQQGTAQIGMADKQNYLNDLMEKYKTGAGLSQNIYGIGANAAGQQSQHAENMGQNSAGMAYGQQNAGGNMIGGLISPILGGIGTAVGGPIGGAIGSTVGGWLTKSDQLDTPKFGGR
jgi:hypothetical protein